MVVSTKNNGDLSMRFTRQAEEENSAAEVIVADFTPKDKETIVNWLNKTLEIDQFSDSDHPLKGVIEVSTALVDVDDVHAAIEKFSGEETNMTFTPKEFIALTEVADMWKGHGNLFALDDQVRAKKDLYDERWPELRDYLLSDTYKTEMQDFEDVVDMFKEAHKTVYPENRTVIDDVDFGANHNDGAVS